MKSSKAKERTATAIAESPPRNRTSEIEASRGGTAADEKEKSMERKDDEEFERERTNGDGDRRR
ncbi:hypothetical protein TSUD_335320 [Trifolium subterraneum]|uniref:Uncharacterized protein n=1 Tax=Trifolium subterraneum TaxID=3900 RepID=A0A2Z6P5W9_TRISU|nr:hypothetical protein TSUD_335320 [Trifolium subterraneum]